MKTTTDATEALAQMGFILEIAHGPQGLVEDNWACISYSAILKFKGKPILSTPYKLGIGHVDLKKAKPNGILQGWTDNEYSMLCIWQAKPYAVFKNKALQAEVAAKLAKQQKVQPDLAGVVHSLMIDGEAFFNAQSFEDWASEFGYDKDSRKAESTYLACDATGRKLANALSPEVLNQVREIVQGL